MEILFLLNNKRVACLDMHG